MRLKDGAQLTEIGGQLVYSKPWHCSLCRRRYRARHLIVFWAQRVLIGKKNEIKWKPETIRLCRGDEVQPKGCAEMGFQRLFFRAKRQTRYSPKRVERVA